MSYINIIVYKCRDSNCKICQGLLPTNDEGKCLECNLGYVLE